MKWPSRKAQATGSPTNADYLVGTSNGPLTNEIVVGTTPGGELGNTWASPTVDATHSGSTHAATQAAAESTAASAASTHAAAADPHSVYVLESLFDAAGDLITATADNTPSKLTKGTTGQVLATGASTIGWEDRQTDVTFATSGALATATGAFRWYNKTGRTLTFTNVTLAVSVAPVTSAILVDVNMDGTTIFTTQGSRPTIAAAAFTGESTTFDVTTIATGAHYLTVDIDQVGTGTTGSNLTVTIWMKG